MRRILLNYARDQNRLKRGEQSHSRPAFRKPAVLPAEKDREIIALNDALNRLEAIDERKAKVCRVASSSRRPHPSKK